MELRVNWGGKERERGRGTLAVATKRPPRPQGLCSPPVRLEREREMRGRWWGGCQAAKSLLQRPRVQNRDDQPLFIKLFLKKKN